MKQIIEISEISDFSIKPGATKSFFVGKINKEQCQIMISEAVKASLTKLRSKPQDAAKFLLNDCQIQVNEQGRMITLAPKLGKAMFTFSGTIHK